MEGDLWSLQADVRWAHYLGQGVGASVAMRRELSEDSEAASFRVVQTLNIQLGVYTNEIPISRSFTFHRVIQTRLTFHRCYLSI